VTVRERLNSQVKTLSGAKPCVFRVQWPREKHAKYVSLNLLDQLLISSTNRGSLVSSSCFALPFDIPCFTGHIFKNLDLRAQGPYSNCKPMGRHQWLPPEPLKFVYAFFSPCLSCSLSNKTCHCSSNIRFFLVGSWCAAFSTAPRDRLDNYIYRFTYAYIYIYMRWKLWFSARVWCSLEVSPNTRGQMDRFFPGVAVQERITISHDFAALLLSRGDSVIKHRQRRLPPVST
jgi:hypothetical protein